MIFVQNIRNNSPEKLKIEEVKKAITSLNIPRGLHPHDPPRQIIKDLAGLYAIPLTIIYSKCLRDAVWPTVRSLLGNVKKDLHISGPFWRFRKRAHCSVWKVGKNSFNSKEESHQDFEGP